MVWKAETTYPKLLNYVIEHDENVGFYIYVYDGKRMISDYLQDTLEIAQRFSFKKFGIPLDAWEKQS